MTQDLDQLARHYTGQEVEGLEALNDTQTHKSPLAGLDNDFARLAHRTLPDIACERVRRTLEFERLCGVTEQREEHLLRVKSN